MAQKQSAFEQALKFVKNNTSRISSSASNFYNNFSKEYDTFKNNAVKQEQSAQKALQNYGNDVRVKLRNSANSFVNEFNRSADVTRDNPILFPIKDIYQQSIKTKAPQLPKLKIKNPVGNFVANLPIDIGNAFLEAPKNTLEGTVDLLQNQIKRVGGQNVPIQSDIRNVARAIDLPLQVGTGGEGEALLDISKAGIKQLMAQGAKTGAKLGALYGFQQAAKDVQDNDSFGVIAEKLGGGVVSGAVGGLVIGAATPLFSYTLKKTYTSAKQLMDDVAKMSPDEARKFWQGGFADFNAEILPKERLQQAEKLITQANAEDDVRKKLESLRLAQNVYEEAGLNKEAKAVVKQIKSIEKKIPKPLITNIQEVATKRTEQIQKENAVRSMNEPLSNQVVIPIDEVNQILNNESELNKKITNNALELQRGYGMQEQPPVAKQLEKKKTVDMFKDVPSDQELALKQLQKEVQDVVEQEPVINSQSKTPAENITTSEPIVPKPQIETPKITQPETVPPAGNLNTGPERERGLVTTVKENPTIEEGLKAGVKGTYNMTTDRGRLDYGNELIKNNYNEAMNVALSNGPDSPERSGAVMALLKDAQQKAWNAKKSGNMNEYRHQQEIFQQIVNREAERGTLRGQANQILHMMSAGSPEDMISWAKEIFDEANQVKNMSLGRMVKKGLASLTGGKGADIKMTKEMEKYVKDKMADIQVMPDGPEKYRQTKALMNYITKDIPTPSLMLLDAYRYQNMLSGVRTHLRNIYNNTFNGVVLPGLEMMDMASYDAVKSTLTGKNRQRSFSEIPTYYRSLFGAMKMATGEFKNTLANKNIPIGKTEELYGTGLRAMMQDRVPFGLKVAGNMLEAEDRFFTSIIQSAKYAQLKEQGMADDIAKKTAGKFTDNILYRDQLKGRERLGQGAISNGIDKLGDWIMNGRKNFGILSWFVPFVKVPLNVAKMSLEYNPFVAPLNLIGNADKSAAWSKMRVGAYVMSLGAMAAASGNTTWSAPSDPELKSKFYDSGRKPYSFYVPTPDGKGKWIPMAYLGPLASVFGIPAAAKYFSDESKTSLTDSQAKILFNTAMGVLNQWTETTPVQGIGAFVRTAQGDIDYNFINNLAFTAGQVVPGNAFLGDVSKLIDPIFRKPKGFVEGMFRNIPGYTKTMEPITNSLGEPAVRNWSDIVAPYGIGTGDGYFTEQYKSGVEEAKNRNVANYYKKLADQETADKSGNIKIKSVRDNQKDVIDAKLKNVNSLLDSYDSISDESVRERIKQQIENQGVNFDDAMEQHILKDTLVKQKGLSDTVKAKMERSNDYTYVKKLRDNYLDTGIGDAYLTKEMARKGITQEDLDYDDKTALADDVQFDEIKSSISGMTGETLLATLMSYRRISEGTRKALLTDSLIGKLEDDGVINEKTADFLKTIQWDSATQQFKQVIKPSKGSKDKFQLSIPKITSRIKVSPIKISQNSLKPIKMTSTRSQPLKIKLPDLAKELKISLPSNRVTRTPVRRIKNLGRA